MHSESRRNFVKKSLATSVTISFAGLIRAHGQEGGGTTWSPNQSTYSSTNGGGTTTWNPNQSTTYFAGSTTWNPNHNTTYFPNSTTWDPNQTTIQTTTIQLGGVIGLPSGYNQSNIVQGAEGFVSAKAQIESDPFSGSGNSVTVKVRAVIWESENYAGTIENSEWTEITGSIDENGKFQSSTSDSSGNFHGAALRTSAWIASI